MDGSMGGRLVLKILASGGRRILTGRLTDGLLALTDRRAHRWPR
jgi:hypothetical protein